MEGESSSSADTDSFGSSDMYFDTESRSYVRSNTISGSLSSSESETISEVLVPIIEERATQTFTLEEQKFELRRRIAKQPERHAYVTVRNSPGRGFYTRDVADPIIMPKTELAVLNGLKEKSLWISEAKETPLLEEQPEYQALLTATQRLEQDYTGLEPDED
jgi:hypothetical protein